LKEEGGEDGPSFALSVTKEYPKKVPSCQQKVINILENFIERTDHNDRALNVNLQRLCLLKKHKILFSSFAASTSGTFLGRSKIRNLHFYSIGNKFKLPFYFGILAHAKSGGLKAG
jgi:hypothetical protein